MTEDVDRRRRQWVPLASDWPWTRTIKMLADKYGMAGPLLWMMVLAAAKRSSVQGTFRWYSESEGWERLGWDETGLPRPDFTLGEFFKYTGQMRRTSSTGAQQVQIRAWTEWNQAVRVDQKLAQKRRKQAQDTDANTDAIAPPDSDLDLDSERDLEAIRTTTPNGVVRIANNKGYECEVCGVRYLTEQRVAEHIELVHTEAERTAAAKAAAVQARQALLKKKAPDPNEIGIPF